MVNISDSARLHCQDSRHTHELVALADVSKSNFLLMFSRVSCPCWCSQELLALGDVLKSYLPLLMLSRVTCSCWCSQELLALADVLKSYLPLLMFSRVACSCWCSEELLALSDVLKRVACPCWCSQDLLAIADVFKSYLLLLMFCLAWPSATCRALLPNARVLTVSEKLYTSGLTFTKRQAWTGTENCAV